MYSRGSRSPLFVVVEVGVRTLCVKTLHPVLSVVGDLDCGPDVKVFFKVDKLDILSSVWTSRKAFVEIVSIS